MYEKNFTEVDSNSVKGTVANIDCKQTRTSFKVYCFTLLNRYKSFNLDQRLSNIFQPNLPKEWLWILIWLKEKLTNSFT